MHNETKLYPVEVYVRQNLWIKATIKIQDYCLVIKLSDDLEVYKDIYKLFNSEHHIAPFEVNEDIREVILDKTPDEGLGISIKGGSENNMPIIISKIFKGLAADKSNQLYVGDVILQVNDVNFTNITHLEAVNALKHSGDNVRLKVQYNGEITPYFIKSTILNAIGWSMEGKCDYMLPHKPFPTGPNINNNNTNYYHTTNPNNISYSNSNGGYDCKRIPLLLSFTNLNFDKNDEQSKLLYSPHNVSSYATSSRENCKNVKNAITRGGVICEICSCDLLYNVLLRFDNVFTAFEFACHTQHYQNVLVQHCVTFLNDTFYGVLGFGGPGSILLMRWFFQQQDENTKNEQPGKPIFLVLTEKNIFAYEQAPWIEKDWQNPLYIIPLISSRTYLESSPAVINLENDEKYLLNGNTNNCKNENEMSKNDTVITEEEDWLSDVHVSTIYKKKTSNLNSPQSCSLTQDYTNRNATTLSPIFNLCDSVRQRFYNRKNNTWFGTRVGTKSGIHTLTYKSTLDGKDVLEWIESVNLTMLRNVKWIHEIDCVCTWHNVDCKLSINYSLGLSLYQLKVPIDNYLDQRIAQRVPSIICTCPTDESNLNALSINNGFTSKFSSEKEPLNNSDNINKPPNITNSKASMTIYELGDDIMEHGKLLWQYPFDSLLASNDDNHSILWLRFQKPINETTTFTSDICCEEAPNQKSLFPSTNCKVPSPPIPYSNISPDVSKNSKNVSPTYKKLQYIENTANCYHDDVGNHNFLPSKKSTKDFIEYELHLKSNPKPIVFILHNFLYARVQNP